VTWARKGRKGRPEAEMDKDITPGVGLGCGGSVRSRLVRQKALKKQSNMDKRALTEVTETD